MSEGGQKKPHIVLFTSPGMGHLIPFCELAHKLNALDCQVTFLVLSSFSTSPRSSQYLENLASVSTSALLKLIQIPLPENKNMGTLEYIRWSMEVTQAHVKQALLSLHNSSSPPSAFIVDMFCLWAKDFVATLSLPIYLFYTSSATVLNVLFWAEVLASQISVPFKELGFGIKLPGLPTLRGEDFPESMLSDASHCWFNGFLFYKEIQGVDGILVNTFEGIEGSAVKAFNEIWVPKNIKSDVLAVGPMISPALRKKNDCEARDVLEWLDSKAQGSVVFMSFGSGALLSRKQIHEIARALEMSGENFLWAIRVKKEDAKNKHVSQGYMGDECTPLSDMEFFPSGFLESTCSVGLAVSSWMPQLDVLSHPSVGGFVTHCGWNSVLESLFCGVPMIPWPMFAEQATNRALVRDAGVAVDLKMEKDEDENVFVKSEEIEKSIRELMRGEGGKRVTHRAKELMAHARDGVVQGGSSSSRDGLATFQPFLRMVCP